MRSVVLGFFVGVFAVSLLPTLPELESIWWLMATLPLFFYGWPYQWARFILFMLAGFVWLVVTVQVFGPDRLPDTLEGEPFEVTGQIKSIPECNQHRCRFDFDILQNHAEGTDWKGRVRISWYYPKGHLEAGQVWRLRLKLKRPHGFINPGGFDYESWLLQRGISATGYVRQPKQAKLIESTRTLNRIRQGLGERLRQLMAESEFSGLLLALTTGDRQHIDPSQWQLLTRTGTIHLIAISGLHIGLLYGLFFWFGRRLWSLSARLCLYRPAQDFAVVSGLLAALVYAALAGFSIPTQRALIMLVVIGLAMLWRRLTSPIDVLLLALMLVLIIDPLAVLSMGFWLSFAAVAIIMTVVARPEELSDSMPIFTQGRSWLHRLVIIQLAIALGLIPLLALFFNQVSLVAPVANLLAVPWLSLLVVPLTLLGALLIIPWPEVSRICLSSAEYLLELLWQFLQPASQSAMAIMHVAQPDLWVLLLAIAGVFLMFMVRRRWWRLAGVTLLIPLFVVPARAPDTGSFQVDFLDVGQSLSVVVRTATHTLLFDTGFSSGKNFDIGQRVILPYLWHQGISRLDKVIVSHDDRDHAGGLQSVLREIPVTQLMLTPGSTNVSNRVTSSFCQAGVKWQWDEINFEILHPVAGFEGKGNDRSCVLRVYNRSGSVLLGGDIEEKAEKYLADRYGDKIRSSVLLAPHHGSKTSSSEDFLGVIKPEIVVYSVGYRNRFKFPHPGVVERYAKNSVIQYRTDQSGMIRFIFHRQVRPITQTVYRQQVRRFWYDEPQRLPVK